MASESESFRMPILTEIEERIRWGISRVVLAGSNFLIFNASAWEELHRLKEWIRGFPLKDASAEWPSSQKGKTAQRDIGKLPESSQKKRSQSTLNAFLPTLCIT